jgi:metal-sulfur cluster biosynthetic enzyme
MIGPDAVRDALRAVKDPCSIIAGTPLSIVAMGLVPDVQCTERQVTAHATYGPRTMPATYEIPSADVDPASATEARGTDTTVAGTTLTDVHVTLTVTEPNCVMFHAFAQQSVDVLRALDGVGEVTVRVRPYSLWSEDDMEPAARDALAQSRAARTAARRHIPVTAG